MTTYYTVSSVPVGHSFGNSSYLRAEYTLIQTAFATVNTEMVLKAPLASPTFTGTVTVPTPTTTTGAATKAYCDGLSFATVLPAQTGNSGKFVTTDGTTASWALAIPSQTGNTGKFLTTDGSSASWSAQTFGYLKVSDQKAANTQGGTSLAADITQVRVLNTVETNTISGASLASNTITLPAGTYSYRVSAPHYNGQSHKAFLYNSTDSTYTGIGTSEWSISGATTGSTNSLVSGQFTIASAKDFKVRHYTVFGISGGLGVATGCGQVEVYTVAEFWKVA